MRLLTVLCKIPPFCDKLLALPDGGANVFWLTAWHALALSTNAWAITRPILTSMIHNCKSSLPQASLTWVASAPRGPSIHS
jgi:hypothetical protein